eukprot:m.210128 g.210128  ORF g.210128 m.210128 type:complete len:709 (+) comp33064_c0_seq1:323-2449(+)
MMLWILLLLIGAESSRGADAPTCKVPHVPDGNGHMNSSLTFSRFPSPNIVPWPAQISAVNKYTSISNSTMIVVVGSGVADWEEFTPLAILFAAEIQAITGLSLEITNATAASNFAENSGWSIVLDGTASVGGPTPTHTTHNTGDSTEQQTTAQMSVIVNSSATFVSGLGYLPLATATVTVLQALEESRDWDWIGAGDAKGTHWNCSTNSSWRLPHIVITDFAAFEYRGIMVDAARTALALNDLKGYVVLARFYKLNSLHIHFTDDDGFTWPSTAFPELANTSSHSYTLDDMYELAAFASARGIAIIGEVDCPGHSTSTVKALPTLFGFPSNPRLGIIDITNPFVVQRMQTIFDEIYAVFKTPIVHMGGDEVNFGALEALPEIKAALKKQNLSSAVDLYRLFIVEMGEYATSTQRTLHAWEGFAPTEGQTGRNAQVPSTINIDPKTGITIQPFDCYYYPPPQLAADGYKIINSAWTPLYIAGGHGEDPELVYQWHPWLFGEVHDHLSWWEIPLELHAAVVGVEMAVWQTSASVTLSTLSARVPAMADRSWTPYAMRTYADFQVRYTSTDAKLQSILSAVIPQPPPPPPAPPPVPNGTFTPSPGACRDQSGDHGPRLEHEGSISVVDCRQKCLSLGLRCDAYDIDGHPPVTIVPWCGVWGETLTPNDASNSSTPAAEAFVYKNDGSGTRVCRGDVKAGAFNTCFRRPPLC